jgi:hypothetical protein
MSLRSFHLVLLATAVLLLAPSVASAAWTVSPAADVAGTSWTNLHAVDCSSANSCMAVGFAVVYSGGEFGPGAYSTVAERWDGTSWQRVPTPDPPSPTTPVSLNGVSCPRPNVCFAVGSSGSGSSSAPLIERWNGASWSIQPSPAVPGGSLGAVSCSGLLACTAVGEPDASGTLAERWDGTGWHVQSLPDPPGSQPSFLTDVSCPLKRTCTAVGQTNGLTNLAPLVERWFGRVNSWGLQAAPKPDGADIAQFSGVSCPDGRVCFAVGGSLGPPGPNFERDITTLAERRVGSKWSVMPTPNPPPPASGRPDVNLDDVSCPTLRDCHAVGDGYDSTGQIVFAERFDGASWQLESIPTEGYVNVNPRLPGLSCPSRLFCMAVGGWNTGLRPHMPTVGGTLAAKWTP